MIALVAIVISPWPRNRVCRVLNALISLVTIYTCMATRVLSWKKTLSVAIVAAAIVKTKAHFLNLGQ